jgi:hypothetical protein
MASAIGKEFDQRLKWIRKAFPTEGRVTVRTKKVVKCGGAEAQGVTWHLDNGDTIIEIERGPLAPSTDTLLHEWAHVLQHEVEPYHPDPATQHSDRWGKIFSKVYRGFLQAFPS